jgi:hypothetical protein
LRRAKRLMALKNWVLSIVNLWQYWHFWQCIFGAHFRLKYNFPGLAGVRLHPPRTLTGMQAVWSLQLLAISQLLIAA